MSFDGYLDATDGWRVFGWAFDARTPDEPVHIDYAFSTGETGSVLAEEFRADLLQHGIGNGRHAFSFHWPLSATAQLGATVTARIRGSDFVLKNSPLPNHRPISVALIAGDIVNNCNLRCPFCVVDYSNIRGLKLMTEETFDKTVELLPQMPAGSFWLSCLHEPTMHPKLIDFIERVPRQYRDRLSFTTNLSRRLAPDWFDRLANSGIHNIRVSFDSRDPELFEQLRSGAKYPLFESNLAQLVAALDRSPTRPHLRFITMAFRENRKEIADLIRYGHDTLHGNSHEVRFMFYLPHLARWGKEHILTPEQWAELVCELEPLKEAASLEICGPYAGVRDQFEAEEGLANYVARETAFGGASDAMVEVLPSLPEVGSRIPDDAVRLRMRWDGLLAIESLPEDMFAVNIKRLEKPSEYFHQLRLAARLARSR